MQHVCNYLNVKVSLCEGVCAGYICLLTLVPLCGYSVFVLIIVLPLCAGVIISLCAGNSVYTYYLHYLYAQVS